MNGFNEQVGGDHYKRLPVQPLWFIRTNGFQHIIGCIIKYACRYAVLGDPQDLEKIIQYAQIEIKEKGATYEIRSEKQMLSDAEPSDSDGEGRQKRHVPVRDMQCEEAVEADASRSCSLGKD